MSGKERPKQDFSDIDHLNHAMESFMKSKRRELGRRSVPISSIIDSCKRGLVFVVLGAVFVTALVGGIQFSYQDDMLQQPESSVSGETTTESQTGQEAVSTNEMTRPTAEGSAVTSITTGEASVTMLPGMTTPPMTTTTTESTEETDESTDATAERLTGMTVAGTTTFRSGTLRTTTTARSTTSKHTTTTKRTTTTARVTTTRKTTTVPTTLKSTTTTTTKATTPAPQANIRVLSATVSGWKNVNGMQQQTVEITIYNDSNVKLTNNVRFAIDLMSGSGITHVGCASGNCARTSFSGNRISTTYTAGLAGYQYATISLTVTSTTPYLQGTAQIIG